MSSTTKQYGMVIDLRRCVGCHACTVVCNMENNVARGHFRSYVQEADKGTYPNVTRVKLPRLCNHCSEAPCIKVCPTGASYRNAEGIVLIDREKCIGCGYCVSACPYEARYLDPASKQADKCTFCYHRVRAGLEPACVSTCIAHARYFGDLKDTGSEVSQLVRKYKAGTLAPGLGTKENVYYIGREALAGVNFTPAGPFHNGLPGEGSRTAAVNTWLNVARPAGKAIMGAAAVAVGASIAIGASKRGGGDGNE
ncbi:4Fe-4S dicluster domain-containing protein [Moorella sp. Hama-1]|uniref:4Fe-4S dicluster domain-containing protein n=1 Tax=Moorella sp. Hama-1 TaxID=2138101 RepID=UPI001F275123|nr:4Fe-4S dicluster domain-containing protein [Moorella sp. Hama-1]MDN5361549.1 tetrathionate reductase subunit [Moorella sp. (in: firmicutes)]BCV21321.1 4Fe-4S ferredoxin [Moorella sp. Hama-1]